MTFQEVIFKVLRTFHSAAGESHLAFIDDRWGLSLTIADITNQLHIYIMIEFNIVPQADITN